VDGISLSQLHDLPTAPFTPFVNTSFKTKDADYVVVSEVQPQSMDEMFAMIIQMKEDYNLQLKKRDEAIASLSLCVSELQEQAKKQETAQKTQSEGIVSNVTSQQPIEELKESVKLQNRTVHQQQVFLEHLANKDRINNLVVTGIPEGNDSTGMNDLIASFLPNEDIKENQDFSMKRLGNNETARKPRPLLLQFQPASTNKRKKMLQNNKKLKDIEQYKKVYIKPDQHPVFRKEHMRLRKVAYEERKKAENHGCNIVYSAKEGTVTKDGIVIDKLAIHFQ
jgi:hypothetical protein